MRRWDRTSPEWLAFGTSTEDTDGTPGYAVYFSTDVSHIDLEPQYEEVMSMGSAAPISTHISSVDFKGSLRSFEVAFSEVSTAAAAATVGLSELLGKMSESIEKLRPQLEMLYYACVDNIETPEQAEAFEALADFLGV